MIRCENPVHEAELAETAARELCLAAYKALLDAKGATPSSGAELAECRRDVARAERHHWRALAQLWRARRDNFLREGGACA